ncbi:MAG: hypothetical protein EAX96_03035 [Candidatus Lokiarchaeota archaeon]|nr:hypothetical protein [Candidatus Lokiarchaeota archaeon]
MSDYGEFDLQDTGISLGKVAIGVLIAMGLSILFFFTLSGTTASLFIEALLKVFASLEVAHLTILGFTLFTLVGPVGYIWMLNPAFIGLDTGVVTFEPILISSVITYVVTGFIIGMIAKKDWIKGLSLGIWTGIGVYIASLVMTLIALFSVGIFMMGAHGLLVTLMIALMVFVMSIPSILICGASGMLGGLVYHRLFVDRYQYRYRYKI